MTAWAGADWGNCQDTFRSTNGCLLMLSDGAIGHFSNRQPIVALSTFESELIALRAGALAVAHARRILTRMGLLQPQATQI